MATGVAVTSKVNALIDSERIRLGLPKEALVHVMLMLALTDPALMARVQAMSHYLDDKGSDAFERMGL